MWWYGRGYSGGSWLPEEKKANIWPGRGNSGGSWPPAFPRSPDTKKIKNKGCIQTFISKKIKFTDVNVPLTHEKDIPYTPYIL